MPSREEILEAMQFDFFYNSNPLNTTGAAPRIITYQFESSQPADMWDRFAGWRSFSEDEAAAVRSAIALIEAVLNVDFVEVTGAADPDLNLGLVELDAYGTHVAGMGSSTVWQTGYNAPYTIIDWDGYAEWDTALDLSQVGMNLILHEIAHAMGLDHSFGGTPLDAAFDNNHYTIMSYTADPNSSRDPDGYGYNSGLMLYDILALQDIWGQAANATGDTVYTGPTNGNVEVIWDTGGTDTLNAWDASQGVILDLRAGAFSTFGTYEDFAIAFDVEIENAVGSRFGDTIGGNALANDIHGRSGDDIIAGLGGHDILRGGAGDDALEGNAGNDRLIGGSGRDTLSGGAGDDRLSGGAGADTIDGGLGADRLVGGNGGDRMTGGDGDDRLSGQGGNDWLYGQDGADVIIGGGGADRLFGGNGDDQLIGSGGRDRLTGGAGDDRLSGDAGRDFLIGGAGRDYLKGGADADTFIFATGAERDVILDFEDDLDTIRITGQGDLDTVLATAVQAGNHVRFDFGDGDLLVVRNITLAALEDDITVL